MLIQIQHSIHGEMARVNPWYLYCYLQALLSWVIYITQHIGLKEKSLETVMV